MANGSMTTLAQLRAAVIRNKNLSADVAAAAADAIDELDRLKADDDDLTALTTRVSSLETIINNLIDGDTVSY